MTSKKCCGDCKYRNYIDGSCIKGVKGLGIEDFCTEWEDESCFAESTALKDDEVNHPKHYNQLPIECKDVIKHFDACRGQAIKYIWRCEDKNNRIQDLEKAIFWIKEKIKMYQDEDAR